MVKKRSIDSLEKSLQELEALVEQMESGEIELAEAMKLFERGVKLIHTCQTTLTQAEQKVQLLTETTDGNLLVDFEEEDSAS